jgi:hypothetical protein
LGTPGDTSGNFQIRARTISLHGCSPSGGTSHRGPVEEKEEEVEEKERRRRKKNKRYKKRKRKRKKKTEKKKNRAPHPKLITYA